MPSSLFSRGATASLRDHGVDPEVLADVAQEVQALIGAVQSRLFDQPRRVVAVEVQERPHLLAGSGAPIRGLLLGLEHPLRGRPRVADQPGGPADQADRPGAGPLQFAQHDQLHQIAEVQARRRGVEAAVGGDRAGGQRSASAASSVVRATSPRQLSSSSTCLAHSGTACPHRSRPALHRRVSGGPISRPHRGGDGGSAGRG